MDEEITDEDDDATTDFVDTSRIQVLGSADIASIRDDAPTDRGPEGGEA